MRSVAVVVLIGVMALAACGGGGGELEVTDVRIGQPTGPNAGLYMTATGGDEDDRLIGAATEVASSVEIHETVMGEDGTMGMQPVEGLALPAGEQLVLEPGGYHMMLIDADRLEIGEMVEVTLRWEQAGEMTVEAEVVAPGETMGEEPMGGADAGSDG